MMFRTTNGLAAGLAAILLAGATPAAATFDGERVVDFDETPAPNFFADTTALRDRYAPVGVTFEGPGSNGGAVLNASTFDLTGFSPPNFLAFNVGSALQGGGIPQPPETLRFRRAVSSVEMLVATDTPGTVTATAYDEDGGLLGSVNVSTDTAAKPLLVGFPRIARVDVTTASEVMILDDVTFVLAPTKIDFDEAPAEPVFANTTATRDQYIGQGVRFRGGDTDDGGTVLDEDEAWSVTGFSPPNIFAINNQFGTFKFGGNPVFPQYLLFEPSVKMVRFLAAGSLGGSIEVEAFDTGGTLIASRSVELTSTMQSVSLFEEGIATVKISGGAPVMVLDDLEFLADATVIDFDDATSAPGFFNETLPLRDRYEPLGVTFSVKGEGGPAIVDEEGDFGVTGYSPPKHLGWNFNAELSNGWAPSLPVYLHFERPIKRIEFLAGSQFGGQIDMEAWDAVGTSVGTTDMTMKSTMQTLALPAEGAVDVTIYSEVEYGILDNLAFQFVDACVHSACYVGEPLAYHCDPCVTKVCATNSDCCNDGWNLDCVLAAESDCSLYCAPLCGDANDDRRVSSADALAALRTGVGSGDCPEWRCDFNGDGSVKSGDALLILKSAVGQSVLGKCPPEIL